MSGAALLGGFGADLLVGDPRRGHPVAGFGQVALAAERRWYAPSRWRGAVFAGVLVAGAAGLGELLARRLGRARALVLVGWAALGGRSLGAVAGSIGAALSSGDLGAARAELPSLVGRDPSLLDSAGVARAVVESVAENTGDAVVGPLVWGAAFGPAGVCAFRAANTLDAMVGHRSARYEDFGWAAARLDDVMAWPAARLGALLAVVCAPVVGGSPRAALRVLHRDGGAHPSPNAGRIEAAFAGALGVQLGGPLTYGDRDEVRPALGDGPAPVVADIARARRLSLAVGLAAAVVCSAARRGRSAAQTCGRFR
ncbi:MAG: cobalamin biosynthesis protein [Solirubrobacteraceae bacterium]|nr:cobalamin biosynthesis protein [Solirubrobacteraceae bacterium]